MSYFYFDETIQERAQFIIGAFVCSANDISDEVFSALKKVGLRPKVDEFKSGVRMDRNPEQRNLRAHLLKLLQGTKIGVVVLPLTHRSLLGNEAIFALEKLLVANRMDQEANEVFLDQGISINPMVQAAFSSGVGAHCMLHLSQDSKNVGGIQLADFVAHSLGSMLLEQLGVTSKMVLAGEGSGYDPNLEVELGFELWSSLRYQFFMAPQPKPCPITGDPFGTMVFDVANYGLHVSKDCSNVLRDTAHIRFGECYLGCIH